jgi:hypothetical protein
MAKYSRFGEIWVKMLDVTVGIHLKKLSIFGLLYRLLDAHELTNKK